MINRHNNMTLFRADSPEQVARLPWFVGNVSEITANYLPVYIVIKAKTPYAAVSTGRKVAQDANDKPISVQMAQEIAPLFDPVKAEFEGDAGSEFEYGFPALQQAILGGSDLEGGVALEEPPIGTPASRLKYGGATGAPPTKGVDPLAGMREMTPGDVDTAISAARAEKDPAKAKSLRQQALYMMAQESKKRGTSRAQCWVEHLLR